MMKKQDIQAEIRFFNKIVETGVHYDTLPEGVYTFIFELIAPYLSPEKILEAGCGTGAFGMKIKQCSQKVHLVGVDLNDNFVKIAATHGIYSELYCANLEDRTLFPPHTFTCIVCPYVLHHFPEMQQVVDNFYSWLQPDGYLIIIDPNGSNVILKLSYYLRWCISKFSSSQKHGSVNESHKSVDEFKKVLRHFQLISIKTFQPHGILDLNLCCFSLITWLALVREVLLCIYHRLPFIKYPHSDVIIIAQKQEGTINSLHNEG